MRTPAGRGICGRIWSATSGRKWVAPPPGSDRTGFPFEYTVRSYFSFGVSLVGCSRVNYANLDRSKCNDTQRPNVLTTN